MSDFERNLFEKIKNKDDLSYSYEIKKLLNEARMKQIKFKDVPIEKRHGLCFDCEYCEQEYGSKVKTCRRKKQPKIVTDGEDYKCYDREENDD